jgi:hypothetical protein
VIVHWLASFGTTIGVAGPLKKQSNEHFSPRSMLGLQGGIASGSVMSVIFAENLL